VIWKKTRLEIIGESPPRCSIQQVNVAGVLKTSLGLPWPLANNCYSTSFKSVIKHQKQKKNC